MPYLLSPISRRHEISLKDLGGGEIGITGPIAINGVPVRRVAQEFVRFTPTKVDVEGADFAAIDKVYLKRDKAVRDRSGEDAFKVKGCPVKPDEIKANGPVMEEKMSRPSSPTANCT